MADSKRPSLTGAPGGRRTFSTAFRGFDQEEVRAYLEALAVEFRELRERIAELESELEAQRGRPATEGSKADVAAITTALGEETARVLRTAQEAAEDLRARAEEGAAKSLADAHEEAARVRASADTLLAQRTAEADEVAARIRAEAEEAAAAMRAEAKEEADRTVAEAIEQGRDMLSQAQAARERVLSDLARRRKVGLAQVERLRAGRDQMSATLIAAREVLNRMIDELAASDEQARLAEESALHGAVKVPDEPEPEEVATPTTKEAVPEAHEEGGAVVAGAAAPEHEDTGTSAAPPAGDAAADVEGDDAVAVQEPAAAGSPPSRAPYRHDRVPAAVLPDDVVGGAQEERPGERVGELFARIRADRAPKATEEEQPAREDHALEAPRTDADESFLQRRDALIEAPLASMVRAVRRGLADEQNLALERIRKSRTPALTVDALLDDEATHTARVARWAAPGLAACARAGASLAGNADSALPEEVIAPSLAKLAEQLTAPVRQRMAEVVDESSGEREVTDRVNSIYREVRGRVDRIVGDAVTDVVSHAFAAARQEGSAVRWVVDDPDGPCADCDDNALAGAVPLGQPFPTGQIAPPAHPGCRCVLAPAPT